jgi:hypothetical protein
MPELGERLEGGVGDSGKASELKKPEVFHFLKDAGAEAFVRDRDAVGEAEAFESVEALEEREGCVGKIVEHEVQFLQGKRRQMGEPRAFDFVADQFELGKAKRFSNVRELGVRQSAVEQLEGVDRFKLRKSGEGVVGDAGVSDRETSEGGERPQMLDFRGANFAVA